MTATGFKASYIGARDDILELIPSNATTILDVGCSIGTLGVQVKNRLRDVTIIGIEIDKQMASVASGKLDQVIVGNAEDIDFATYFSQEHFDCVIFADVLEHLKDPWAVLKNITNYLKPGGTIVASIPNIRYYDSIFNLAIKGYWPYRDRGIHDRTHLRFFTKKNASELFASAGLQIVQSIPKYRIIEKPHGLNTISKYFAVPMLKEFITFQYLIVAKK